MKICSRCGNEYNDFLSRCPKCGLGENGDTYRYSGEQVKSSFTSTNIKESVRALNIPEISNITKVFITFLIMLFPILGPLFGLLIGTYYTKRINKDTKQFGSVIIIFSIILLIITIGISIIVGIIIFETYNEFINLLQYY